MALRDEGLRFRQQAIPVIHSRFSNSAQREFSANKVRGSRSATKRTSFSFRSSFEERIAAQRSSFGVFLTSGPRFRDQTLLGAACLSPNASHLAAGARASVSSRASGLHSSHSRQRAVVRADGDPKPPRRMAANHARRRRPFPAIKTPHERALDGNGNRNIILSCRKVKHYPVRSARHASAPCRNTRSIR
jgi:hypothetical protein